MSKKRNKRRIIIGVGIAVFIGVTYPFWIWSYHFATAPFFSPEMLSEIREGYREMPSEKLINKIKGYCNPYSLTFSSPRPFSALRVLVERQEEEAVPTLIGFMDCWIEGRRQDAIWALGRIGDDRAIEPLMKIVSKGEEHPDYYTALLALSRMKHEEVFPHVVEIARKPYPESARALPYLKEFGKLEGIPFLKAIQTNINDDYRFARFHRTKIDNIIEHIREANENKNN